MIYYGPQLNVDSKRSRFQPAGDEIIVMQQHCGGENLIVYKGSLRPNSKKKENTLRILLRNKFAF